jgi:hypothetical protein
MIPKADGAPGAGDDIHDSSKRSGTLPPPNDDEPAASPPKPLDDMPVPPLTEPSDTSGG